MKIDTNVGLAAYSTMGLGGSAAYLCLVTNQDEVAEATGWARQRGLDCLMIGGGSNLFWQDTGFPGLVIVNNIAGYQITDYGGSAELMIGAGETWDRVVERSVRAGLTGIEALSLIPGKAGATPIQNVGAYGQEISETLVSVEAYDNPAGQFVTLAAADCGFGYRTSRFKTVDRGRFFITAVKLRLHRGNPAPPYYASVQNYFSEHHITTATPTDLRQAVIDIRTAKLPDPAAVHNCGSFFANPLVTTEKLADMQSVNADIPNWPSAKGIKISAAWLIERSGFKDFHDPETGMATWPRQPLVLVNEKAASTADLLAFKQKIIAAVQAKFGLTLEQEPELLP